MQDNGPDARRINLVLIGDGYTADQQDDFYYYSYSLMNKVLNNIAFINYRPLFNCYSVFVASNESGADYPPSVFKDTYFSATFNIF